MKKSFQFALLCCCFGGSVFAQNRPMPAAALVVGISQYQDTTVAAPANARRNAEEYAALLLSPGIGLAREQILLLTDAQATLANFNAGLDWLLTETPDSAQLWVYVAGAAQFTGPDPSDALLFLHDSPNAPLEGNTFSFNDLGKLLRVAFPKKTVGIVLIAALENAFDDRGSTKAVGGQVEEKIASMPKLALTTLAKEGEIPANMLAKGPSNLLVAGLLGLADLNGDQRVSSRELFRFLKNRQREFYSKKRAQLWTLVSDKDLLLARTQPEALRELAEKSEAIFPPIVNLESQLSEDATLRKNSPGLQHLFEDFILSIKVKNYLPPTDRNAASLYDSLIAQPELQPIFGHCRRRLTAAMLDDVQQVLNAYLNYSLDELANRERNPNPERYAHLARLLAKASELIGQRHFMYKTIEAKRLYFEGLSLRLAALLAKNDSTMLRAAEEKQRAALGIEPDAAYIANELGVVYKNLNLPERAKFNWHLATALSPTWGIPYANLCIVLTEEKNWVLATENGIQAVACSPRNPAVYGILGNLYLQKQQLADAEKLYLRALRLNPNLPIVLYNLACIEALRGHTTASLDRLRQAHERGFKDVVQLFADPDLRSIRNEVEFANLVQTFYPKH